MKDVAAGTGPVALHIVFLIIFLHCTSSALAHRTSAYNHDGGSLAWNPSWMSYIDGSTRMSQLSVPGTHDTMTYGYSYGDSVPTQAMSLKDQLNSGIRALDIRCRHINNRCAMHHGDFYLNANFNDVMDTVARFLDANPKEAIFMRVKQPETALASDSEGCSRSFADTFAWYISQYRKYIWDIAAADYNSNPTLDMIRGKVVILQNFGGQLYGIYFYDFNIQDNYYVGSNWDLYAKWEAVKAQLTRAGQDVNTKYMNYLSASTGSFPYFVASGHSSPQTDAPNLLTGRAFCCGQGADYYPDFPRVSCLGTLCSVAFEGTNVLTANWLGDIRGKATGLIYADYPGAGLIESTIAQNGHLVAGYVFFYTLASSRARCIDLNDKTWEAQQWDCNGASVQRFRLVPKGSGLFNIVHAPTGRCLDINGASQANGARLITWWCNGGINQLFSIQKAGDTGANIVRFVAKHSGKCVDVNGRGSGNGVAIQQWDCNWTNAQQFGIGWAQ